MRFLGFLTRRIVGIAAVMVGVSIITFAISHIIPADPIAAALGDHATDQQIEAFRSEYHLDRPLPEQYLTYVVGLAHGDLGRSIRTPRAAVESTTLSRRRPREPASTSSTACSPATSRRCGAAFSIWSCLRSRSATSRRR